MDFEIISGIEVFPWSYYCDKTLGSNSLGWWLRRILEIRDSIFAFKMSCPSSGLRCHDPWISNIPPTQAWHWHSNCFHVLGIMLVIQYMLWVSCYPCVSTPTSLHGKLFMWHSLHGGWILFDVPSFHTLSYVTTVVFENTSLCTCI